MHEIYEDIDVDSYLRRCFELVAGLCGFESLIVNLGIKNDVPGQKNGAKIVCDDVCRFKWLAFLYYSETDERVTVVLFIFLRTKSFILQRVTSPHLPCVLLFGNLPV